MEQASEQAGVAGEDYPVIEDCPELSLYYDENIADRYDVDAKIVDRYMRHITGLHNEGWTNAELWQGIHRLSVLYGDFSVRHHDRRAGKLAARWNESARKAREAAGVEW